ncbi:SEC14 cytosolic factor-like [Impatiens glandulifera]|uniref:SEC14 cytosolic factor-like n=1 Tax=Impatiens glandulifera TaxID=253017 RepID=UPI001FB12271|nr:SEC14 cytosolic factor-like [Impatiens glandulifera]
MAKKKEEIISKSELKDRAKAVLQLLWKQTPLSIKQEKFCDYPCLERFLKSKGYNVKKAAKQLRACLSWRENFGIDHLMADEFSSELVDGVAYVAGNDQDSRPVMVFRFKQFHSQKMFIRLLVFTLEVAIQSMSKGVEQFVLLFDASFYKSGSGFMNVLVTGLKTIGDYYPGRLHKTFLIDPPSFFSFLWKGVRPFVDSTSTTTLVSSLDYEEEEEYDHHNNRLEPTSAKIGSSSRFSFTVSHHFDSLLKPWYLTLTDSNDNTTPKLISPLNARSLSFSSPAASATTRSRQIGKNNQSIRVYPRTPNPRTTSSFFQSPAVFFRGGGGGECVDKCRESFVPYTNLYRRPYDEMIYRSMMKPPLGGLISIIPPHLRRRHVSLSQRF